MQHKGHMICKVFHNSWQMPLKTGDRENDRIAFFYHIYYWLHLIMMRTSFVSFTKTAAASRAEWDIYI
jgi:hypothetical protein